MTKGPVTTHRSTRGLISGVVCDFDGTITSPGSIDFQSIRMAIGCPDGRPMLEYVATLPPEQQSEAKRRMDEFEMLAAEKAQPAAGLSWFLEFLRGRNVPIGVLTRNTRAAVDRSILAMDEIDESCFSCIVTRDDTPAVKPAPDGVYFVANALGVEPSRALVIGDYVFDIEAGRSAGATTCFVDNTAHRKFEAPQADIVVSSLHSLPAILHTRV